MDKQEILQEFATMQARIGEIVEGLEAEEDEPEGHWPGMFKPNKDDAVYYYDCTGYISTSVFDSGSNEYLEMKLESSKTRHEAEFIKSYQEAQREVKSKLLELNGGDPGWINWNDREQEKWLPLLDGDEIQVYCWMINQYREDWFHAKTKKIWLQVIEELGEGTVKLALFPHYEPENK